MNRTPSTAPLDAFRERLAARPDIERALADILERDAFVAAATAAAADLGLGLTPADLEPALLPDPIGLRRLDAATANTAGWPSADWLPVAVVAGDGSGAIDWLNFGSARLTDPFFEGSARKARFRPFNWAIHRRTPLAALAQAGEESFRAPNGFIFHMSRCGSTLAAQMLAAVADNVVVSEAPPLDAIVQLVQTRLDVPVHDRLTLLRAMVGALGRRRFGETGAYIIKLDSWHSLALPLFRAAFPDTPWIFLYRDPVEVLVSHHLEPGAQTVPGMMDAVYGIAEGQLIPRDEYAARVLAMICTAAVDHHPLGGGLMVDYATFPDAIERLVLPHFGITLSDEDRAAVRAATSVHSKSPSEPYSDDRSAKQNAASDELRRLAIAHLAAPIARLRALTRCSDSDTE